MIKKSIKIALFADLHYKNGYYAARVADVETIIDGARKSGADLILHCGDLCNNYAGSPELTRALLENTGGLPVCGVYGNHELESAGNDMPHVTPLLTNLKNVTWGTADGKIGDGHTGYYRFDKGGFRFICTDTNYSFDQKTKKWIHNLPASWDAPPENACCHSLGPDQLIWLEKELDKAAENGMPCIIVSHASLDPQYICGCSPDAAAAKALIDKANEKKPHTVLMNVFGHYHADGPQCIKNGVLYFSVNSTINGFWTPNATEHYTKDQTVLLDKWDKNGNLIGTSEVPAADLLFTSHTHYFKSPLYTVVEIKGSDEITVATCETDWLYGVVPPGSVGIDRYSPKITGGRFVLNN